MNAKPAWSSEQDDPKAEKKKKADREHAKELWKKAKNAMRAVALFKNKGDLQNAVAEHLKLKANAIKLPTSKTVTAGGKAVCQEDSLSMVQNIPTSQQDTSSGAGGNRSILLATAVGVAIGAVGVALFTSRK